MTARDSCTKHRNRLASLGTHIANQSAAGTALCLEALEEHFERLRCLRRGTQVTKLPRSAEGGCEASPHALRAEQRLQVPAQATCAAPLQCFCSYPDRAFSTEGSEGLAPCQHRSLQSESFLPGCSYRLLAWHRFRLSAVGLLLVMDTPLS